jgi:hypothetical protein
MKYFVELECENIEKISDNIYEFLKEEQLLGNLAFGWNFIDCKKLLLKNTELLAFFRHHNLLPRHAAVTVVANSSHLPKHIDELPVIAKINIPVINTTGWANRWYVKDTLVAELMDMKLPVAFNSQVEHSVDLIDAVELPRIIASFTFYNEPLHLLQ